MHLPSDFPSRLSWGCNIFIAQSLMYLQILHFRLLQSLAAPFKGFRRLIDLVAATEVQTWLYALVDGPAWHREWWINVVFYIYHHFMNVNCLIMVLSGFLIHHYVKWNHPDHYEALVWDIVTFPRKPGSRCEPENEATHQKLKRGRCLTTMYAWLALTGHCKARKPNVHAFHCGRATAVHPSIWCCNN